MYDGQERGRNLDTSPRCCGSRRITHSIMEMLPVACESRATICDAKYIVSGGNGTGYACYTYFAKTMDEAKERAAEIQAVGPKSGYQISRIIIAEVTHEVKVPVPQVDLVEV